MTTPRSASATDASDDIHEAIRIAQGARTKPKIAVAIVAVIAVCVVTGGWLAGWFAPTPPVVPPKTCAGQVDLAGAGVYSVGPAMRAWTAEYNTSVCAKVSYVGAASGVGELASKSVDFAAIDGTLNASDATALGASTIALPVALEATSVVYNVPGLPAGLNLSGEVLAGIYLGAITSWNSSAIEELNPGVHFPPTLPITPVHCDGSCDTSLLFTGYLARANATWNSTVGTSLSPDWPSVGVGEPGSAAVVAEVNATPGSIGYVELPLGQEARLSDASLANPADSFVAPSAANTTAAASAAIPVLPPETGVPSNQSILDEPGADSYPMATLSYVVVYQDLGAAYSGALTKNTAQWLGAYVLWITTAAQPSDASLGYAPLPAVLVTWNQDSLEKLQYYGQSVLAGGDFDGGL